MWGCTYCQRQLEAEREEEIFWLLPFSYYFISPYCFHWSILTRSQLQMILENRVCTGQPHPAWVQSRKGQGMGLRTKRQMTSETFTWRAPAPFKGRQLLLTCSWWMLQGNMNVAFWLFQQVFFLHILSVKFPSFKMWATDSNFVKYDRKRKENL